MGQKFDIHLHGKFDPWAKTVAERDGIVALFERCGMQLSHSKSDIFELCGRDMPAINNGFFDIFPSDFGSDDPDIVRFAVLPKYFFEIFPREGINTPFCIINDRGRRRFSKGWNKAFGCSLLGWPVHDVILQDADVVGERIESDDHFAEILRSIDPVAHRNHILLDFQELNRPEIHVLEKVQDVGHWHRDWQAHNRFYLDNAISGTPAVADCDSFEELIERHRASNHFATVHCKPGFTFTDSFLSIIRLELSTQRQAGSVYSDDPTDLRANRFAAVFDADNSLRIPCPVYHDIPLTRREIRYT